MPKKKKRRSYVCLICGKPAKYVVRYTGGRGTFVHKSHTVPNPSFGSLTVIDKACYWFPNEQDGRPLPPASA